MVKSRAWLWGIPAVAFLVPAIVVAQSGVPAQPESPADNAAACDGLGFYQGGMGLGRGQGMRQGRSRGQLGEAPGLGMKGMMRQGGQGQGMGMRQGQQGLGMGQGMGQGKGMGQGQGLGMGRCLATMTDGADADCFGPRGMCSGGGACKELCDRECDGTGKRECRVNPSDLVD